MRLAPIQRIAKFVLLKSKALHIISSVFLTGPLLFAQVTVNFFHNNHDVHQLKSVSIPFKEKKSMGEWRHFEISLQ